MILDRSLSGSFENVKDCVLPRPRDTVLPTYDLIILTILCVLQYFGISMPLSTSRRQLFVQRMRLAYRGYDLFIAR